MNKFLLFLAVVVLFKFSSNAYYWLKTKNLYSEYQKYVSSFISDTPYTGNIIYKKNEIKDIFKKANARDSSIARTRPTGFGQIINFTTSAYENMFVNDKEIISSVINSFETSIGEFSHRMFQAVNPIWWVECIIYLPRNVFTYLGIKDSNMFIKIVQIMYWIITGAMALFHEELLSFLSSLLKK